MRWTSCFTAVICLAICSFCSGKSPLKKDYPYRPTPATKVELTDQFWRPRIETNRTATVPYSFGKCEETGRIENFKIAGGLSEKKWRGEFGFDDSDVSKIIEGAAYCWMTHPDDQQQKYVADLVSYYAAAQEDDGFLYTLWTARETIGEEAFNKVACRPEYTDRWSLINNAHQLYNLGHMFEAGVAHFEATGDRGLLDVCRRSADLVCKTFGLNGIALPPGHEEIEIGLVKLYRVTGEQRYLDQAKFFIEQRGRTSRSRDKVWGPYSQDHLPLVEQDKAVGHAVRAGYFYAAATDLAAIEGNTEYTAALDRLWRNVVETQMYITGGVGGTAEGEAFGAEYQLPNETAYCETCAQIAQCLWNHRLFLLHGDGKYLDVLERILYNGMLSGVSLDGKKFFYPNPLSSSGQHERSPWFGCSCCPSNLCRFIPSVPGFFYAVKDDNVYVNLYAAGTAQVEVQDSAVKIEQQTTYPRSGEVKLIVTPLQDGAKFALKLRIPGWARNEALPGGLYTFVEADHSPISLTVNSEAQSVEVDHGFTTINRVWNAGDEVALTLPMPVRRVLCSDKVAANRGRVALQRGPLVYCVEHPDVAGGKTHGLVLTDDAPLAIAEADELLSGVTTITGVAQSATGETVKFAAIPYYAWAHRGKGEMDVWLARGG